MKNSLSITFSKSKIQRQLIRFSCLLVFIPFGTSLVLFDFFQLPAYQIKAKLPALVPLGIAGLIIYYYLFEMFRIWLKKYKNKKPIFIVDGNGITDGVSINSVGFIPWKNIKEVSTYTAHKHYLVISLNDEKEVLNNFKGINQRKKFEKHLKKYGTNVRIQVDWLDGNIYIMKKFIKHKLEEYQKTRQEAQELLCI